MTVDILKTTMVGKLPNDLEGMEASMECLLALIDDVYKYVDDVVVRDLTLILLDFLHCIFLYVQHINFWYFHTIIIISTISGSFAITLLVKHNKDTTRLGRKVEHSCSDPVTMTPEPLIPQGCRQVHLGKSKGFWKTISEGTWTEAFYGLGISLLLTSNPAIQVSFKCQCSCQIITLNLSKEGEYF
ncbi:hypothetical protein HHK36_006568 [Tetracentron sinense]|uniref:Uncharacterized protein n=1 Tax=Tetracentron sinense TaxID=13715 RepID=A0A834ZHF0_TETSI|nr:hypothetical protein HHK36_006568 [Tetracentron sinense]